MLLREIWRRMEKIQMGLYQKSIGKKEGIISKINIYETQWKQSNVPTLKFIICFYKITKKSAFSMQLLFRVELKK